MEAAGDGGVAATAQVAGDWGWGWGLELRLLEVQGLGQALALEQVWVLVLGQLQGLEVVSGLGLVLGLEPGLVPGTVEPDLGAVLLSAHWVPWLDWAPAHLQCEGKSRVRM